MKELMKLIQDLLNNQAKDGNKKVTYVLDADFASHAEDFIKTKAKNVFANIGTMQGAPQNAKPDKRFLSFHQFMNP